MDQFGDLTANQPRLYIKSMGRRRRPYRGADPWWVAKQRAHNWDYDG